VLEEETGFISVRICINGCSLLAGRLNGLLFNLKIEAICSSEMSVDFSRLHGRISQKTTLFIITAVRTSCKIKFWSYMKTSNKILDVRFEVFTAVTMKKASSGMWHRADVVLTDVPPKRWLTPHLHGATSQKTTFFKILDTTRMVGTGNSLASLPER
jgi:hypothetical protein